MKSSSSDNAWRPRHAEVHEWPFSASLVRRRRNFFGFLPLLLSVEVNLLFLLALSELVDSILCEWELRRSAFILLSTLSRFAASSSMTDDDTDFCFLSMPGSFGASRNLEDSLIRSSAGF